MENVSKNNRHTDGTSTENKQIFSGNTNINLGRQSLEYIVENFEKEIILKALETARGNQTKTANLLLTTKRVIQYKVRKYRIDYRRYRGNDRSDL
jgi:DNA-binding NtrC family response regulator